MYIFKHVKYATLNFDKYPELLKTKLSKVIFYAIFFIFLSNLTYILFPFISSYNQSKGFNNFIEEYTPDFTTKNNKLVFDKYYKVNNHITNEDKKYVYNNILKVTPTNIISSNLNINIKTSDIIKVFNINEKADLINLKFLITTSTVITFILFMISFIFSDILKLIISTFIINSIAKFYNLKSTFSEIFKLTIYVNTLPFILKLFLMPMPIYVYIGFIAIYLHFIFKHMQEYVKSVQTE